MYRISLPKICGNLFVIIALFPWVGISGLDSQPFPYIMAFTFLFISLIWRGKLIFPSSLYFGLTLFLFAICVSIFFDEVFNFLSLRAVIGYLGIFVLIVGFEQYFRSYGVPIKILYFVNVIWLIGGILQTRYPNIFEAVVPVRTTLDRGVTGFAPEPTFFAIYLYLLSFIYFAYYKYQLPRFTLLLVLFNVFFIVVVAKSLMGLVFIFVTFSFWYFICLNFQKKIFYLFASLAFVATIVFGVDLLLEGSRISSLAFKLLSNPLLIIESDASINARVASVVLPLHASMLNFGFPGGFNSISVIAPIVANSYDGFFWYGISVQKIMSWNIALVYELGFLAFLVIWFTLAKRYVFAADKVKFKYKFFEFCVLFVVLFSAIPHAFTLVPFLFVTLSNRVNFRAANE